MIAKRAVLAFVLYVALTFAWAVVWNLLLFKDAYHAATAAFVRDPPIFALGLAAIAIQAAALIYLFERYYRREGVWEAILLTFAAGVFTLTFGALVIPAKFLVQGVATYALLELGYGGIHHTLAGLLFFRLYRR
jgi:hypothetical protein